MLGKIWPPLVLGIFPDLKQRCLSVCGVEFNEDDLNVCISENMFVSGCCISCQGGLGNRCCHCFSMLSKLCVELIIQPITFYCCCSCLVMLNVTWSRFNCCLNIFHISGPIFIFSAYDIVFGETKSL